MDTATLAVVLTVSGGAAEFVGLGFVVRGIAHDRQQARHLFRDIVRERPSRTYPAPMGQPLTPRSITEHQVGDALVKLIKISDAKLDKAVGEVLAEMDARDRDLRSHLRYVLTGSVWERGIGVVLLAGGIVLSVAGNLVAIG